MKKEGKTQAVERMKARDLSLRDGYTFDRNKANVRRAAIAVAQAAAKDKRADGPSAARSQDFLYSEDGMPN